MPPKASTSSLRGGRGRGKGFKLALPEPSLKKGSTISSPGSSTQKAKQQEESSTQLVVKSESSTQNSSKPQTSKQTKVDYDFPIEILLALQDCGLTKLPKKTWADIAFESDDESEIDLKALIQKARDSKIIYNTQKEKQIAISTPLTNKAPNNYIFKNKFSNVLHMEPEFWDENPYKAVSKAFPSDFQFQPIAKNKTRIFYEFVLIDSNSVSIKHFKDPKNPLLNTHSTIQILKVLQPRHFGTNLNEYKKFSQPFDPAGYSYWDYIDAWTNVFWHQNNKKKHSWLIIYNKTENNKHFPTLQRHFFIKWWNQFDASKAESDKVKIWFKANPEFLRPADPETSLFLNQKSQLAAFLAGSKSKEHLTKNLKEVLKMLHSQEEAESSSKTEEDNSPASTSSDVFYQNEDDCFGINLNED
ncbi:hypothetical protein CR513_19810, partial [Mucuna pruriens]